MLKMLLYPNVKIYILSNVGTQAQETFMKLEEIAKNQITSIDSVKDIFINEVVTTNNSDGFVHDKASFRVSVFGGGTTFTLNSVPENIRGKRANLIIFDESSFCSEELISAAMPFITQESDFKTSVDSEFNIKTLRKEVPTQAIFASSAGSITSKHAKLYKEYALRMVAGDSNYFVADIPCTIPLSPLIDGEPSSPLITKSQVETALRTNPDKAKREFFNKFQADGGESQIIKWASIRRNETFTLPQLANHGNEKFALALDPARTTNNSILTAMKILYDDDFGYYGEIVNCTNLIDLGKRKKTPMKSQDQIRHIKQSILDYNGNARDYDNIEAIMIDSGAGGGGISAFADRFLDDWTDSKGARHRGLIDPYHELYADEIKNYPNAVPKLRLISPQKYKNQMVEELIELMRIDAIKFPKEYNGKPEIPVSVEDNNNKDEVDIKYRTLSIEEQVALVNIDILKTETTSIHKFENREGTSVSYALPKEKRNLMEDDRFYTLIMLAHYLYELRRKDVLKSNNKSSVDISKLFNFRQPRIRKL